MPGRSDISLETFIFAIDPYHFGIDIAALQGVKEPSDFVEFDGKFGQIVRGHFRPVHFLTIHELLDIPLPDSPLEKRLLLTFQDQDYAIGIEQALGIFNLNLAHLYKIPRVLKSFISPAFWAIGRHNQTIVLLLNLVTLLDRHLDRTS